MARSQPLRVINIGPRERRKRLMFGSAALAVGAAIALLLIFIDAPLGWRAPLFLPFFFGALGVFQAREKT
jgi:hypothetical protein